MWLGFIIGVLYSLVGFQGQGQPPRLHPTCGPFRRGHLHLCGYHIHHWVVALPSSVVCFALGSWDLAVFCLIMTAQGLSFSDRFDFTADEDLPAVAVVDTTAENIITQQPVINEIV